MNAIELLILADGTAINPLDGSIAVSHDNEFVEVPTNREAVREITAVRRQLNDLPAPTNQMNSISVVLSYTLFGLDLNSIALATGFTTQQVENIQQSEAYTMLQERVVETIYKQDKEDVRSLISRAAARSAQNMIRLANCNDPLISLSANKDILDRAGHRPADVVEHRHKMEGGLVIRHITRNESTDVPTIDITPEGDF